MPDDFRVKTSFFSHPKTRRLKRRHGDTAVVCLMRLWAFATEHRCKGVLYDMNKDDIVDIAEWHGDGEFVDSLVEFGLLDIGEGWYELHDWRHHNGWAYFADERTERARENANKRWKMDGKSDG